MIMDKTKICAATDWAAPTDYNIARWEALTRDEQLEQLQKLLGKPESNDISASTFDEVVARARAKLHVPVNG